MDFTGHVTSEQAAELLGINRQSLYNLVNRDPDFPKPTKLGALRCGAPRTSAPGARSTQRSPGATPPKAA